jgi:hypothetical protein
MVDFIRQPFSEIMAGSFFYPSVISYSTLKQLLPKELGTRATPD